MTDLSPILPKLSRLVPRLSSDADGEVVATVRAIDRMLRASGFDWHDFTSALTPALPPPRPGRPERWRDLADWCVLYGHGLLTPKEMAFVRDMVSNLGRCRHPTERQAAWLLAIYDRLGRPQ